MFGRLARFLEQRVPLERLILLLWILVGVTSLYFIHLGWIAL
jgi:hypothetical protein